MHFLLKYAILFFLFLFVLRHTNVYVFGNLLLQIEIGIGILKFSLCNFLNSWENNFNIPVEIEIKKQNAWWYFFFYLSMLYLTKNEIKEYTLLCVYF